MQTAISRVFMHCNSQAVRIPQEFTIDADQVEIHRKANGDLVVHPLATDRGAALLGALSAFDEEFVALLEEDQVDTRIPSTPDRR